MSTYLEIARVTATLQQMIQEALEDAVPGAVVRVGPPRAVSPASGPEVNLYLYMVSPNSALRNQGLPTRAGSTVLHRPEVAIDLHYVISFYGEQELASERMLGKVVSRFHAHPILTFGQMDSVTRPGGSFAYLHPAGPENPEQIVRLNPYYASLEELSKLWTVFFQMAHRVTLQYVAGPILIDADLMPVPPLPAAQPQLTVATGPVPFLTSITPEQVDVVAANSSRPRIVVIGQNLQGTHVEVDRRRVSVDSQSSTHIDFSELPAGLFAGTLGVVAISHDGTRSNTLPLVLLPHIVGSRIVPASTPSLQVQMSPAPAPSQPLSLLLNQQEGGSGFELGPALQFPLPESMQELTVATARTAAFAQAFAAAGVAFPPGASLEPLPGGVVRAREPEHGSFCFVRHRERWWVRYGLDEECDEGSVAFRLPRPLPVPPGEYLLRIRILQTPAIDSRLLRPRAGDPYTGPVIVLPEEFS